MGKEGKQLALVHGCKGSILGAAEAHADAAAAARLTADPRQGPIPTKDPGDLL